MFKVTSRRLFWWPVAVKRPDPDAPGKFVEDRFDMQFEALEMGRAREIDAARAQLPADQQEGRAFDFLFEISKGWRDVVDEDGQALAFDREIFGALLENAWFRDGVLAAYADAMAGREARLGN